MLGYLLLGLALALGFELVLAPGADQRPLLALLPARLQQLLPLLGHIALTRRHCHRALALAALRTEHNLAASEGAALGGRAK